MTCRSHKNQRKRSYCIIAVVIMKQQLLALVFTFIVLAVECSNREYYAGVCIDSHKEEDREYYASQCYARCPNGYTRTMACTCKKNVPEQFETKQVQMEEKLYMHPYDRTFLYIILFAAVAFAYIIITSPELLYGLLKETGDVLEDAAHLFAIHEAEINV